MGKEYVMVGTSIPDTRAQSGWLDFAGILGILVGGFNAIEGLVALFRDDYFLVTQERILVFDFTTWGWVLLVMGLLQIGAGIGLLMGQTWARVVGVGLAFVAALTQLAFMAAYPIWSALVIALCVLVIYGLIAAPKS
jgi:hypothetical protein